MDQSALWVWEGRRRGRSSIPAGQNIVFKTVLRVNLNHFRGLLVSGRLSISALNRADRPFVVLSGTDFAPRIQVDSYSSLN